MLHGISFTIFACVCAFMHLYIYWGKNQWISYFEITYVHDLCPIQMFCACFVHVLSMFWACFVFKTCYMVTILSAFCHYSDTCRFLFLPLCFSSSCRLTSLGSRREGLGCTPWPPNIEDAQATRVLQRPGPLLLNPCATDNRGGRKHKRPQMKTMEPR